MVDFTLLQMHSNWKLFSKFECRRSSLKKGKLFFFMKHPHTGELHSQRTMLYESRANACY